MPSLSCRTLIYKGLLLADQIEAFYPDLADPSMTSGLALVHQRYSTNTFPTWNLAQPFRFLCHNGEINTLRGNINWMKARQGLFKTDLSEPDISRLFPILIPGASDSAILDNAVELLYHTGRSLPHAIMMLIPEAWQNHKTMSDEKKAFYEYHSCLMEPWDGPASIPFTDGRCIGAVLDRNGLRPSRYTVTQDGFVVMASETGVLDIDPANVLYKGRLQPGRMLLVDTDRGRIVDDEEIKAEICTRKPYRAWLTENLVNLKYLPAPRKTKELNLARSAPAPAALRLHAGGPEDHPRPDGDQGPGAHGLDGHRHAAGGALVAPPAALQLFQAALRAGHESAARRHPRGTGHLADHHLGSQQDLFKETPEHCRQLRLEQPILTNEELEQIRELNAGGLRAITLPMLYQVADGGAGLEKAMDELCAAASRAIDERLHAADPLRPRRDAEIRRRSRLCSRRPASITISFAKASARGAG